MPRIAEIKEIDGHIWVRADIPNLENGSAWWSPAEQEANYKEGYRDGKYDASQWRPIAEAPMDGGKFLVYHAPSKMIVVSYIDIFKEWVHIDGAKIYEPTHFMPLPDAPTDSTPTTNSEKGG